jgi:hypothetical protein
MWLEKSADKGVPAGQFNLARMLIRGCLPKTYSTLHIFQLSHLNWVFLFVTFKQGLATIVNEKM